MAKHWLSWSKTWAEANFALGSWRSRSQIFTGIQGARPDIPCVDLDWPQIMQTGISFRSRSDLVLDDDHYFESRDFGSQDAHTKFVLLLALRATEPHILEVTMFRRRGICSIFSAMSPPPQNLEFSVFTGPQILELTAFSVQFPTSCNWQRSNVPKSWYARHFHCSEAARSLRNLHLQGNLATILSIQWAERPFCGLFSLFRYISVHLVFVAFQTRLVHFCFLSCSYITVLLLKDFFSPTSEEEWNLLN